MNKIIMKIMLVLALLIKVQQCDAKWNKTPKIMNPLQQFHRFAINSCAAFFGCLFTTLYIREFFSEKGPCSQSGESTDWKLEGSNS